MLKHPNTEKTSQNHHWTWLEAKNNTKSRPSGITDIIEGENSFNT
jgi:hypothetical protein